CLSAGRKTRVLPWQRPVLLTTWRHMVLLISLFWAGLPSFGADKRVVWPVVAFQPPPARVRGVLALAARLLVATKILMMAAIIIRCIRCLLLFKLPDRLVPTMQR